MKIRLLSETAKAPKRATPGSSCWDVYADEPKVIMPGERALIRLGVSAELALGTEIQVRPRSGLAVKTGITCEGAAALRLTDAGIKWHLGTIDSDYRGEIGAIIFNLSDTAFEVKVGDRIAQFALCAVIIEGVEVVNEINTTERGVGGYGSTGR